MALLPKILAFVMGGDTLMDFVDMTTGKPTTQYFQGSFPCFSSIHKGDGLFKGQLFHLRPHLLLGLPIVESTKKGHANPLVHVGHLCRRRAGAGH